MKNIVVVLLLCWSFVAASCTWEGPKGLGEQPVGQNVEVELDGAAVSTVLGNIIRNEMEKDDRQQLNSVCESGRPGQTAIWDNQNTGSTYQVTPQPFYIPANSAMPCRKAEIQVTAGGKNTTTYTTACRDDSGQWVLQSR